MFANQASRRSIEAPNPNFPLGGGAVAVALRNRIAINNQTATAITTTGAAVIVAVMRLTARVSGVFQVSFNIAYTTPAALVSADTYAWTVTQQNGTGAFAYVTPANMTTLTTAGGIGQADAVANVAGTAIATGGGGASTEYAGTYKSNVAATGTGQVTFNWTGDNNDLPIVVGHNALFIASVNMSAHPMASIDNISMSMYELP